MVMVQNGSVLAVDRKRGTATVEFEGRNAEIFIDLLEKVEVGDQLLVHLGMALNRIDPAKAAATLERMAYEGDLGADMVIAA